MQTSRNGSHVILRVMKLAGAIVCVALTLFVVESHRDRSFLQRAPRAYAESQQSVASLTTTEALTATLKFAHEVYLETGRTLVNIDNSVLVSLADLGIVEVQPATSFGTEIVYDAPLAIALARFDATATASGVMLTWETVSEIDNQGFHVLRSGSTGVSATAQAFVPSLAPGSSQGASYEWLDTDVLPGGTYFYWLEDFATSGILTHHGPVRIELETPTAVKSSDFVVGSASTSFDLWWLALICVAATLAGGALGVWRYARC